MKGSQDDKGPNELSNGGENDAGVTEEVLPELDIIINNVVCSFNVRCHLNLRDIAYRGLNVEYRRENGVSWD
jgi:transcription initiation factor TFIID TATA-box-binding protein